MPEKPHRNIVFFDGVCGLCDHFVDFLMARDRGQEIFYATLQGETYELMKRSHPRLEEVDSVVLFQERDGEQKIFTHSDAALRAVGVLPAPWSLAKAFLIIPRFLRNPVYRLIAKVRYRIFGKKETCRIPTPEERAMFLP